MRPITVRQESGALLYWPIDPQIRVVPQQTTVVFARVVVGDLVDNLGIGFKRAERVREADGNEDFMAVFRRQLGGHMAAEGRRGAAKIDRDVENAPAHDPYELVLGEGGGLEMQPADRPRLGRQRMVFLDEVEIDAGGRKLVAPVHFREEAARVAYPRRDDQPNIRDSSQQYVNSHGRLAVPRTAPEWRYGRLFVPCDPPQLHVWREHAASAI